MHHRERPVDSVKKIKPEWIETVTDNNTLLGNFVGVAFDLFVMTQQAHGRAISHLEKLKHAGRGDWLPPDSKSLEYQYYISSAALTEEQFAKAVRGHWGIENKLHWVLDVTMKEEACPIYRGEAAQILATVKHMAQNMLRVEKSKSASIRRKQKIAAINSDYLE